MWFHDPLLFQRSARTRALVCDSQGLQLLVELINNTHDMAVRTACLALRNLCNDSANKILVGVCVHACVCACVCVHVHVCVCVYVCVYRYWCDLSCYGIPPLPSLSSLPSLPSPPSLFSPPTPPLEPSPPLFLFLSLIWSVIDVGDNVHVFNRYPGHHQYCSEVAIWTQPSWHF